MNLDVVIPVRNRENTRLLNCINSLGEDYINKIVIVDYGSTPPIQLPKFKQNWMTQLVSIPLEKIPIWNKPHALNIGIKHHTMADYIALIDVDIILSPDFFKNIQLYFNAEMYHKQLFLYTSMVKRLIILENVNITDPKEFEKLYQRGETWFPGRPYSVHPIGGIQIVNREWINDVGGLDEHLSYWGGPDTDLWYRALHTITAIHVPFHIIHQEHQYQKGFQLPFWKNKSKH